MLKAFDEVADDGNGLFLREFGSFFDEGFQIAFIAELSDDVTVVGSTVDVMAFEYVGMVEFFEGIDFTFEHFFLWFALDWLDIDDFDGNGLLIFLVDASVDNRAETFSDDVFEAVGVVFDFFSEIIIRIELPIHVWEYEIRRLKIWIITIYIQFNIPFSLIFLSFLIFTLNCEFYYTFHLYSQIPSIN